MSEAMQPSVRRLVPMASDSYTIDGEQKREAGE